MLEANSKVHDQDIQIEKLKFQVMDLDNKFSDGQKEVIITKKTLQDELSRRDVDQKVLLGNVNRTIRKDKNEILIIYSWSLELPNMKNSLEMNSLGEWS